MQTGMIRDCTAVFQGIVVNVCDLSCSDVWGGALAHCFPLHEPEGIDVLVRTCMHCLFDRSLWWVVIAFYGAGRGFNPGVQGASPGEGTNSCHQACCFWAPQPWSGSVVAVSDGSLASVILLPLRLLCLFSCCLVSSCCFHFAQLVPRTAVSCCGILTLRTMTLVQTSVTGPAQPPPCPCAA